MLLYYTVLILHALFTIFLFFGWLFNNKNILRVVFTFLLICLVMFIVFDGCIVTKWERKLSNSDFTVLDPLLSSLGIKLTNNMRYNITLSLYIISLSITTYKLFYYH